MTLYANSVKVVDNSPMKTFLEDAWAAMRARQWIKNLLLIGAPLGAAVDLSISNSMTLLRGVLTFCFISSAGYIVNDWFDKEKDRLHSKKKSRPFADRRLNGAHAFYLISLLALISFALAINLPRLFHVWVFLYAFSTISYSLLLKKKPVIELISVAFGFLVRCLAGAALFEVYVSQWFLIVTAFGSLFLISTKRAAELSKYEGNETREVITSYSEDFLKTVVTVSITITLMGYALWAFEVVGDNVWGKLSILPVLVGVLRYLLHTESADAEAPERAILSDRMIPISGLFGAIFLILAIYT